MNLLRRPIGARWLHAFALLAIAGALISYGGTTYRASADARIPDHAQHAREQRAREVRQRFEQAVVMLHARQFDHAIAALDRVVQLEPRLPEAHVNLGFAWLGLQRADLARQAFDRAIDLRPTQANAYYGLAVALEQGGELDTALGAMRSYLHLSKADDPHRARARSALWEWEQRLGRHRGAGAPVVQR